jgi:hypothetical protein
MACRLELVRGDEAAISHRIHVCDIGEIDAPEDIGSVGLGLGPAQEVLGKVQLAYVEIQEASIKTKALMLRIADPTLALKDYRERRIKAPAISQSSPMICQIALAGDLGQDGARLCFLRSFAGHQNGHSHPLFDRPMHQ